MTNIKDRILSGLSWNLNNQIFTQVVSLVTGLILVRYISPDKFGIYAILAIISTYFLAFGNIGINQAVIQSDSINNSILSSAFWIQFSLGIFFSIILFFSANKIAIFYEQLELELIIKIFVFEYFIGILGQLQNALFQRKLDFRTIFNVNLWAISISSILAIFLAIYDYGIWSLVVKSIVFTSITTLAFWIKSDWQPSLQFNIYKLKDIFKFSFPFFGNQLLNISVRNIDDILIGKTLGMTNLGLYNRSYNLMLLPVTNISKVISNVLFPSFSRIQNDPETIKHIYFKVIRSVSLITFPLMIGLFILTAPFVHIVFGPQWVEIIPIVKVLSILGLAQSIGVFNGSIYLSMGQTSLLFKIEIFLKLFIVSMIVFGVFYTKSLIGITIFYTIASFLTIYPKWYFMSKLISTSFGEIISQLKNVFYCSILMGISIYFLNFLFPNNSINIVIFSLKVLFGIMFYWFLISFFKLKSYTELLKLIKDRYY